MPVRATPICCHGRGCRISMTQTGDPLHNALAERMNNTLKNSWHISSSKQSFDQALLSVEQAVRMYNEARPHQALGGEKRLCKSLRQSLKIRY